MATDDVLIERTTLWHMIVSLAVAGLGIALLFAAAKLRWMIDHPRTQSVARSLAGLLIVSVAIAMLWQLRIKRAFLEEVMDALHPLHVVAPREARAISATSHSLKRGCPSIPAPKLPRLRGWGPRAAVPSRCTHYSLHWVIQKTWLNFCGNLGSE
jgi:hypothetical protein